MNRTGPPVGVQVLEVRLHGRTPRRGDEGPED
jgi:hypothetical protein